EAGPQDRRSRDGADDGQAHRGDVRRTYPGSVGRKRHRFQFPLYPAGGGGERGGGMKGEPSFIDRPAWNRNTFNPATTEKGEMPVVFRKQFIFTILTLINRISALTKLFSARKALKTTSNLLMVAGCSILLSGCEAKKPAGPPEKFTIAIPKNINPVLMKIADVKGYFREEGLDVNLQLHSSGKAAIQSLLDGKADLAAAADTPHNVCHDE